MYNMKPIRPGSKPNMAMKPKPNKNTMKPSTRPMVIKTVKPKPRKGM